MARARTRVEAGSGDVFADLGFADAGERSLQVRLAWLVNQRLTELELTQREAGEKLGLAQPHVSELGFGDRHVTRMACLSPFPCLSPSRLTGRVEGPTISCRNHLHVG